MSNTDSTIQDIDPALLELPADFDLDRIVELMGEKGVPLYQLRGLNESHMEALYAHGYGLYTGGQYELAEKVFLLLGIYDHLSSRNWLGLGSTQFILKKFKEAVYAFSFAGMLDPQSPLPPFHAAECLVALGNQDAAFQAFEAAETLAADRAEHAEIHQKAKAQKALLAQ